MWSTANPALEKTPTVTADGSRIQEELVEVENENEDEEVQSTGSVARTLGGEVNAEKGNALSENALSETGKALSENGYQSDADQSVEKVSETQGVIGTHSTRDREHEKWGDIAEEEDENIRQTQRQNNNPKESDNDGFIPSKSALKRLEKEKRDALKRMQRPTNVVGSRTRARVEPSINSK